ncbi:MAG: response regulator [Desulfuromonadales bacterium]
MKIIIVEDDSISSQILKRLVTRFGTVDHVDDGRKAVDLFRQAHESGSPYDLIFMDIMMPVVDGLESVQTIRQLEKSIGISESDKVKIIMTTALTDPRTVMKALYESDANSYLVKPITLQKLTGELKSLKLIS